MLLGSAVLQSDLADLGFPTAQARCIQGAELQFSALIAAGCTYSGKQIAMDDGSRSNLQALVIAANMVTSGQATWTTPTSGTSTLPAFDNYAKGWVATDGSRLALATPQDAVTLALAVSSYYSALVQHETDLITEALTATTVPALPDPTSGWRTTS